MPSQKQTNNLWRFFHQNSLSIALIFIFFIILIAQFMVGWHEYNHILENAAAPPIDFWKYLQTGHCWQATFENWESEFLQMFAYVLMTVYFRQKGSSESKPVDKKSPVDRKPHPHPKAPWPVKKGGWILKIYQNSLSIAFFVLFLFSFIFHAYGSYAFYKAEQILNHRNFQTFLEYLLSSRFWFESFQNWQSEFLAVASIVILSIFLRQQGSPESKPVDASHSETANQ